MPLSVSTHFAMPPCSFQLDAYDLSTPLMLDCSTCFGQWDLGDVIKAKAWSMLWRLGFPPWVSCHCHEINTSQGAIWGGPMSHLQLGGRSNRTHATLPDPANLQTCEHDNRCSLLNVTELEGHLLNMIMVAIAGWVIHIVFLFLPSCHCECVYKKENHAVEFWRMLVFQDKHGLP